MTKKIIIIVFVLQVPLIFYLLINSIKSFINLPLKVIFYTNP